MITVKDLWRGALPSGTELVGGGAGLERRVEWATALRTRPPAFEAIKGGELAFVPVRSIRMLDERLTLAAVIRSFGEKGGVAVAILGDASQEAIGVAESLMLPLLRLPDGAHVADVQQTAVRYILEQRTLLHERQQEVHTQLMALALASAGPAAIIDRLGEITGHPAVWQDVGGQVVHVGGPAADGLAAHLQGDMEAVRRWAAGLVATAADPPVHEFTIAGHDLVRLVAPVPVGEGLGGFVSLLGTPAQLDQLARVAVSRAASACAIELDRERAVLAARDELEGEFVESLLAGTYSSEPVVRSRAERLSFAIGEESVVMVARLDGAGETIARSRRDALLTGGQGWVRRRAPGALVTVRQGGLAAVLPLGETPVDLRRLAADLRLECAGAAGVDEVSVGVGRAKPGFGGVRVSYREAEQAIGMGVRLFGGRRVVAFADLGLHRLLFAVQTHPEVREFYDDTVRALVDYDARSGAGLMRTLDAYFHCHGSPTDMAALLHLHRNTVLYRLRRIEEIGGLRLDDPQTRLNLHLCLRIRDVLQAGGTAPAP